jgi:hypothetical protein
MTIDHRLDLERSTLPARRWCAFGAVLLLLGAAGCDPGDAPSPVDNTTSALTRDVTAESVVAEGTSDQGGPQESKPTVDGVTPDSVCDIKFEGKPGQFICEYGWTPVTYQNRAHVFVVGTDFAIWEIWQVSVNGPPSNWTSLGGVARSGVSWSQPGDGSLTIRVLGTDNAHWCRTYNRPSARGTWDGWHHC